MYYHAILSGVSAALGSLFGKLSGLSDWESFNSVALKMVLLVGMFFANACVWTFFVKALQSSKSSLSVTVTSSATNYLCSAVAGYLFFHEVTSLLWWTGTSLIIIGIIVMNKYQNNELSPKED